MQRIEIEQASFTIGRKQSFNVSITDEGISRSPTVIRLNFSTGEAKICSRSSNQNRIQNTGSSTELGSNFIRLANMKEETIYSVETQDIKDKKEAKRDSLEQIIKNPAPAPVQRATTTVAALNPPAAPLTPASTPSTAVTNLSTSGVFHSSTPLPGR